MAFDYNLFKAPSIKGATPPKPTLLGMAQQQPAGYRGPTMSQASSAGLTVKGSPFGGGASIADFQAPRAPQQEPQGNWDQMMAQSAQEVANARPSQQPSASALMGQAYPPAAWGQQAQQQTQTTPGGLLTGATQATDQGRTGISDLIKQVQANTDMGAAAAVRRARERSALDYIDQKSDARRLGLLGGAGAGTLSAERANNDFLRYGAREALAATEADAAFRQQQFGNERSLYGDLMGVGQQYGALSGVSRANELQPFAVEQARQGNVLGGYSIDEAQRAADFAQAVAPDLLAAKVAEYRSAAASGRLQQWEAENAGWLGVVKGIADGVIRVAGAAVAQGA